MKKVMWRSPWAFDRNLVILCPIGKGEDPSEVDLNLCDFHVRVSALPAMSQLQGIARIVGDALGRFVKLVEDEIKGCITTKMRIRVTIDITKPLLRCMNIAGPRKQLVQIRFAYERLPNFCYFYGVLGHLVKDCHACLDLLRDTDKIDESKLEYGEWLRVPARDTSFQIIGGVAQRNARFGGYLGLRS